MKATFTVTVEIDSAVVEVEGKRRGMTLDRALESVIADCENRLCDSVRFRDGVERVATHVRSGAR